MIDIIEPFDPHGPILTLSCEKMILGKILKDFSKILKTPLGRPPTGPYAFHYCEMRNLKQKILYYLFEA